MVNQTGSPARNLEIKIILARLDQEPALAPGGALAGYAGNGTARGLADWQARGRYASGWEMLTSQDTPKPSTHMPNSSPQTCFCSGIVMDPLAASWSK
jgi:hypothetical protein